MAKRNGCNPLVSVVMPIFNTEYYLDESIGSILGQTFRDIELICVDDGSTDGSLAVCKKYAQEDDRVITVVQKNNGQGYARNRALDIARGEYVYFMDSDDRLEPTALRKLTALMEKNDLDVLFFSAAVIDNEYASGKRDQYVRKGCYEGIWSGDDLFEEFIRYDDYIVSPCLYLTRRSLIENKRIRFLEHEKHEDDIFTLLLTIQAQRAMCINDQLFNRRYRPGSTMTTYDPRRSFHGAFRTYSILRNTLPQEESAISDHAIEQALLMCKQSAIRWYSLCNRKTSDLVKLADPQDDCSRAAALCLMESIQASGLSYWVKKSGRLLKRRFDMRKR